MYVWYGKLIRFDEIIDDLIVVHQSHIAHCLAWQELLRCPKSTTPPITAAVAEQVLLCQIDNCLV